MIPILSMNCSRWSRRVKNLTKIEEKDKKVKFGIYRYTYMWFGSIFKLGINSMQSWLKPTELQILVGEKNMAMHAGEYTHIRMIWNSASNMSYKQNEQSHKMFVKNPTWFC